MAREANDGLSPIRSAEAFFVPGTHAFRVYGYGTTDSLDEVLAPDYFRAARGLLRAGELIYVSTFPEGTPDSIAEQREPRSALVMVRTAREGMERASASVRLVQDFGCASDSSNSLDGPAPTATGPLAPPAPIKRGRGRPPGSRNRQPETV
jgi:hypothetical protein